MARLKSPNAHAKAPSNRFKARKVFSPNIGKIATRKSPKIKSLRQRLFAQRPERQGTDTSAVNTANQTHPQSRKSVKSIFHRLEVGFGGKRATKNRHEQPQSIQTEHISKQGAGRSHDDNSSPLPPSGSSLLSELQDEYVKSAVELHEDVCQQLITAHMDLSAILDRIRVDDENALAKDKEHVAVVLPPMSSFVLNPKMHEKDDKVAGPQMTVGDIVKKFQGRRQTCAADLAKLWTEWEAADREVRSILDELAGKDTTSDTTVHSSDTMMAARSRPGQMEDAESLRNEFRIKIQAFEDEVDTLTRHNTTKMKNVEKAFRKTIQQDFMLFHQFILE